MHCYEKNVRRSTYGVDSLKSFSTIYKYLPFVSVIIGLIIFVFVPHTSQTLIIFITLLIIMTISLIASIPHIMPSTIQMMEDLPQNYKNYLSKYNPQSIESCAVHHEISAISRCPICFRPLCGKDLTFTNLENPNQCRSCTEKYMNTEISATIYYLLATCPLAIIGVMNEIFVGFKGYSVMFIFIPFIIFFLPLGMYLTKRTSLSKSKIPKSLRAPYS